MVGSLHRRSVAWVFVAVLAQVFVIIGPAGQAAAAAMPKSLNVALVPNAFGRSNFGGSLPTSGFPAYTPSFTNCPGGDQGQRHGSSVLVRYRGLGWHVRHRFLPRQRHLQVAHRGIRLSHDNFASAKIVDLIPYVDRYLSSTATREVEEPSNCDWTPDDSVWYRLDPETDLDLRASTSPYMVLAVFEGDSLQNLRMIGCDMDNYTDTRVNFVAHAVKTYYFQLSMYYTLDVIEVEFRIEQTGAILGTITNDSGDPLSECVQLFSISNSRWPIKYGKSDAEGNYHLVGVDPADYKVQFGCWSSIYQSEWYQDQPDHASANVVSVTTTARAEGIDATLARRGSISGKVTIPGGAGVKGIRVEIHKVDSPNSWADKTVYTREDGTYIAPVDAPGDYQVAFLDRRSPIVYGTQWSDGRTTPAEADVITVTDGIDVPGVDAVLEELPIPPNDHLASATSISAVPYAEENVRQERATREVAEDYCGYGRGTVWYKYTPSTDEVLVARAAGGSPDVAIYTGPSVSHATLAQVACGRNSVEFAARAGVPYYIQVGTSYYLDTYYAGTTFVLEHPVVPNDNFDSAKEIPSAPFDDSVSNRAATLEEGEPAGCGPTDKTVWYRFVPGSAGLWSIGSGRQPSNIAVYRSASSEQGFGSLDPSPVTCSNGDSSLRFTSEPDAVYLIQLGSLDEGGPLAVTLRDLTPPINDDIANAQEVNLPATLSLDTVRATIEQLEPTQCGAGSRSVWYRYSPSATTTVVADTQGSSFNTALAVYRGDDYTQQRYVNCNDDVSPLDRSSLLAFRAYPGQTYFIQAYARSLGGTLNLTLDATVSDSEMTFEAPTPCLFLCPYWSLPLSERYEKSCDPEPPSPAGSWDDENVTVPTSIDELTPRHVTFRLSPDIDYDSFLCHPEPEGGKYFINHDANSTSDHCGDLMVVIGCEEVAVARAAAGQRIVLRAYNWSDGPTAAGSFGFTAR